MVDVNKLKEVENKIRDVINLVSVYNNEEEQDEGKLVEDEAATELKKRLQDLAKIVETIK